MFSRLLYNICAGIPDRLWEASGETTSKKLSNSCEVWVYVTASEVRFRHEPGPNCTCGVEHGERSIVFSTRPGLKTDIPGHERQTVPKGFRVARPPQTRVIRHYFDGRQYEDVYKRYHQTWVDGKWQPSLPINVDVELRRYHRGRGTSPDSPPPAQKTVRRPDTVVSGKTDNGKPAIATISTSIGAPVKVNGELQQQYSDAAYPSPILPRRVVCRT